jgi:DNA-binding response OmpR family regulator
MPTPIPAPADLSPGSRALYERLYRDLGSVIPKAQIVATVPRFRSHTTREVDSTAVRLQLALRAENHPLKLTNVWGVGYRLEHPTTEESSR